MNSSVTNDYVKRLDEIRKSAKFHPSIWGDYFLAYNSNNTQISRDEEEELAKQKEMVRKLLVQTPDNSTYKLELIDAIQRLGVEYHFDEEIGESLQHIYLNHKGQNNKEDNDLVAVALRFRLLRQQGYNVPCGVFQKFTDNEGNFIASLGENVEGLLSLYEAAHLLKHDDVILEKAIEFCSSHLHASLHKITNVSLSKRVNEALILNMPFRKTLPRPGTRKFITLYEEDESHDKILLKFAKMDFNLVQKMHQKELSDLTRWWKKFDVANKMPYARDRIVELFVWIMGIFFEPRYAKARSIAVRHISMASIIDDTYEYATLEELQILTDAIQRWPDVIATLEHSPPYIQICYKCLVETYNEIEEEMEETGESYRVQYAMQEMKKLVSVYFEETKWLFNNYVPTMEEYMKVAIPSCAYMSISTASLVGMGDQVSKQDFDWITNEPLILVASSTICRLMDDLAGEEFEQKTSAIECYMKQYGVSKEEACAGLQRLVENAWKDMNGECIEPKLASMKIRMGIFNLSRVMHLIYANGDGYSDPTRSKELVKMLLVEPVKN